MAVYGLQTLLVWRKRYREKLIFDGQSRTTSFGNASETWGERSRVRDATARGTVACVCHITPVVPHAFVDRTRGTDSTVPPTVS
jgi:hypothetical protein